MKHRIITFMILSLTASYIFSRQPERGYRGFADWSNSLRNDRWNETNGTTSFYTGISTSHGYQFNPWLFFGAGVDYEHCQKTSSSILSLFAHSRTDLRFGNITPFGDIRIGYNFARGGGIYMSPTIGYRLNWGRKAGINIGLGLTLQGYCTDIYETGVTPDGWWIIWNKTGTQRGLTAFFSFRIGFDF